MIYDYDVCRQQNQPEIATSNHSQLANALAGFCLSRRPVRHSPKGDGGSLDEGGWTIKRHFFPRTNPI
jgi:hypothetical protein